jgi:hypothetical protein
MSKTLQQNAASSEELALIMSIFRTDGTKSAVTNKKLRSAPQGKNYLFRTVFLCKKT